MKRAMIIVCGVFIAIGCKKINRDQLSEVAEESLVSQRAMTVMAGGGEYKFEDDLKYPVYIHFLHEGGASNYRFFETEDIDVDPMDYSAYKEVKGAPTEGIFNGFMQVLKLKESHDRWGILTYSLGDSLRLSSPVEIKAIDRETQTLGNFLEIDEDGDTPTFSWSDGSFQESDYFVFVLTNEAGEAISSGRLNEKAWTFYNASALAENLLASPEPLLELEKAYSFTVFGVTASGWMNIMVTKSFST